MTATPALTFRHYTAPEARAVRTTVQEIHDDAYAQAIATNDPFDSTEAFMTRFDAYTDPLNIGFELVIAYLPDNTPVGQTWGWPLTPTSSWWKGLQSHPDPTFTQETGTRTFALSEIMVRRPWTGQGIAHALHNELLATRPEQRATLLVEPDNPTAYRAYTNWGWQKVSDLRPSWPGSPIMHVLLLRLPLRTISSP